MLIIAMLRATFDGRQIVVLDTEICYVYALLEWFIIDVVQLPEWVATTPIESTTQMPEESRELELKEEENSSSRVNFSCEAHSQYRGWRYVDVLYFGQWSLLHRWIGEEIYFIM